MHQPAHRRRHISIIPAVCAAAVMAMSSPAAAQFACTSTATDVTCNNSGTAVSETNFDLTKNVTTNNSGTVTTFIGTGTGNSGNATTTNWGTVGTDINTTTSTIGNATTTNYGSIGGSVDTFAFNGSAVGTNYGTVGGNFLTQNESGGIVNAFNYGSIGGSFQANGVFDSASLANFGSVGSISTSAPNGGDATTTNQGSVATSITTYAFHGTALTTNTGSVGTSISTTTANGGNATTINWGSVGTNISSTTATGGAITVTNYGSVGGFITGTAATGSNVTVTNYGSVGGNMQAVAVFGTATAANYGTAGSLTASSPTEDAIAINSGRVSGQVFILGSTRQTLTNAGTISNPGGTAIMFSDPSPTTLTLLPGSFIVGAINLNAGATTHVTLDANNLNMTFNTLANATVTSTLPFAVSGNQAATLNPTSFGMTDRNLMDFSRGVSAALPEIEQQNATATNALAFSSGAGSSRSRFEVEFAAIPGLSAYAKDRAVFANPTMKYSDGTSVWARGFAGERDQPADGALLHTANQYYGGILGIDMAARENLRLGAFVGGGETRSTVDFNYGNSKSDIVFAGVFAQYSQGLATLRGTVQGGHSTTDESRNINNNTIATGLETAKATYGATYFSPEANLGLTFALGSLHHASYTLTPSVNVRYLFAAVDGYTESGSTANLSVASRYVQNVEERGQLKLTSRTLLSNNKTVLGSVYGGVIGVQRAGSTTVDATLLGQPIPFAAPGKSEVYGGFGGAGIEWHAGQTTLFAGVEYLRFSDSSSIVSGRGGVKIAF